MANIPLSSIKFPNLSDTYTIPQVDDTLSVTGDAADAKATGDAITNGLDNIQMQLSETNDVVYTVGSKKALNATASNWKLLPAGNCKSDSSYAIDKYYFQNGGKWYLKSAYIWQFQNSINIPSGTNTSIVGYVHTTPYDGVVEIPSGATYIMVGRLATDTESGVYYYSSIEDEIESVRESAEPIVNALATETVSGAIASFSDGAEDIPVKSLTLNIEPQQSGSGDPSPTNVRSISGHTSGNIYRTGKNLLEYPYYNTSKTASGITFTLNSDGSVGVNGTATATADFYFCFQNTTKTLAKGTYKYAPTGVNFPSSGAYIHARTINDSTYINTSAGEVKTFTIGDNDGLYAVSLRVTNGTTITNGVFYPLIMPDSFTDTSFEPYASTTIPITWDSAGTVYGGTLDVVSGEMTVTHGINTVGNRSWTKLSSSTSTFYASMSPAKASGVVNVLSDSFKTATNSNDDCSIRGSNSSGAVYIRDDRYTDASSFKSGNTSVEIVYGLATPLTYTLTPQEVKTLLGSNNIWTDVGRVNIEYRADTMLYVDKRTNAISAMIAPTEASATATRNYSIGSYLVLDDQLYKVTAAIASGGTITVGTNVTATTIMAEIMAL